MSRICGTSAGYYAHRRREEKPCGPCLRANAMYHRDYRRRRRLQPPVESFADELTRAEAAAFIAANPGLTVSLQRRTVARIIWAEADKEAAAELPGGAA